MKTIFEEVCSEENIWLEQFFSKLQNVLGGWIKQLKRWLLLNHILPAPPLSQIYVYFNCGYRRTIWMGLRRDQLLMETSSRVNSSGNQNQTKTLLPYQLWIGHIHFSCIGVAISEDSMKQTIDADWVELKMELDETDKS